MTQALTVHESDASLAVALEAQAFELAQRKAAIYAKSSLVPQEYKNNVGNVLIAENMARRMGADTLMVMQNLYVVHGKPGWSAVFLIACFNTCGRFSAIKYRFEGEPNTDEYGCIAYCTEIATGDLIEGTKITRGMAVAEGWVNKPGSKWKTIPEQMFRYRAATFLIRSTAPEIGMGLLTKDELDDMPTDTNGGNIANQTRDRMETLRQQLVAAEPPVDAINGEPEIDIHTPPPDTDPDVTAADAEFSDLDTETENLRAFLIEKLDTAPASYRKDLLNGRKPEALTRESIDELLVKMEQD